MKLNQFLKTSILLIVIAFNSLLLAQKPKEVNNKEWNQILKNADQIKFINPKKSIEEYQKFYELSLQKKDTIKAIKALIGIGFVYSHNVNYSKSYDYYWKALLLAENTNKDDSKSKIYQGLGWLYSYFNKEEEALKYINKSLELSKQLVAKKKFPIARTFGGYFALTNFYRKNNNYEMYQKYLDSCFQIKNQTQETKINYYLETELGYKLTHEKKYAQAIEKLKRAKKYYEEKNDTSETYIVIVDYLLGEVYQKTGDYDKSINAYLNSLTISKKLHCHADYRIMSCDGLVEVYKKKGDHLKAFEYLEKSKEMNEQIFSSKSESNKDLLAVKDTYRITKEKQEKLEAEREIKILKQEEYIWFLKSMLLIVCILFLLIFGFAFIRNLRSKHKNEKKIIKERQELELKRKNEILELKNKELTASALQLIEKEEFLNSLKNKLSKQKDNIDVKVISRMVNNIQGNPNSNWKEFEARFTNINQSFYTNLKAQFPKLSQTDQKICALIKLNFSSKEMSSLLGISAESVHTSRYRLRKKLGLTRDQNLTDFINTI
ncbi:tetratricopeptide repeat protein [Wenyingzhuangia sp. 1_MG-2023]|nr:tetratricopeptide repeat protein [Wenyingzhuangia sp. 1_MG-2023]